LEYDNGKIVVERDRHKFPRTMVYLKGGRALMSQPVARPTIQQFRRDFRLTSGAEENKARTGHGSRTAGLKRITARLMAFRPS